MHDFENSITVNSASDVVFAFLSDLNNLPQYLPMIQHTEFVDDERIRVEGQANGKPYTEMGFLLIEPESYRMEWGTEGESYYKGWLQVEEISGKVCEVVVHLSFDSQTQALQEMDKRVEDRWQVIDKGLEDALQNIKYLCEGKGAKVKSKSQP